jgi:hypothetical protein
MAADIILCNLGRIPMLLTFSIAAIVGIAIGYFLRVSALAAASLGFVVYSLASNAVQGTGTLYTIAISFALLSTLQTGYICGLLISGLGKRIGKALAKRRSQRPDRTLLRAHSLGQSNESAVHASQAQIQV